MSSQKPDNVESNTHPVRTKKAAVKQSILFVDYNPTAASDRKDPSIRKRWRDVRSHAAAASADKRKATIAKKEQQQRLSQIVRSGALTANAAAAAAATTFVITHRPPPPASTANTPLLHSNAFQQLIELVTELQGDRKWYLGEVERSSLAHKAMRSILWDAMTNSTTLFQAAAFVAGTFCNSCGLPPTAVHMGSGLIVLRGASFNAIQSAISSAGTDSLLPVSIAMLAGWERRFGDQESFNVHMQAWRCLALPPGALDENHVATLTDLTMETFRESLDERSQASAGKFRIAKNPLRILDVTTLPPGFGMFQINRNESQSLLGIVSQLTDLDPHAADSILRARRLSLENLSWSPTHTISCNPEPTHENQWDQLELKALYHVRAAMICLLGLTTQASMDFHRAPWVFDMKTALHVHAVSCQHLASDRLMTTKFQEIAVWCRFLLCATSRDPPRDEYIRDMLRQSRIASWPQMQLLLKRHIYPHALIGEACREFFESLMLQQPATTTTASHMSGDERIIELL